MLFNKKNSKVKGTYCEDKVHFGERIIIRTTNKNYLMSVPSFSLYTLANHFRFMLLLISVNTRCFYQSSTFYSVFKAVLF